MDRGTQILLIDAGSNRRGTCEDALRQRGFTVATGKAPAALVLADEVRGPEQAATLAAAVQRLEADHVATVVWGAADEARIAGGPLVEWLGAAVPFDEVVGRVAAAARYAPLLQGFERELEHMRRLGEQLNNYFTEIDQEMRLAGRLQRDFLPREFPRVPPLAFHSVYRPASWVSGDMYDVFRVDETHLGVFVADAMGHGVAAGLLTMFLRLALVSKEISGQDYRILTPAEVMHRLHAALVRQELPNSQFVTAAYGVVDTQTGRMKLARAGHPYPVFMRPGGEVRELRSEGSLLGLADVPAEFEELEVTLAAGDKVLIYTDGMEDLVLLPRDETGDRTEFTPEFTSWARQPAADLVRTIEGCLDHRTGSLHPADDVTVLLVEIDPAQ